MLGNCVRISSRAKKEKDKELRNHTSLGWKVSFNKCNKIGPYFLEHPWVQFVLASLQSVPTAHHHSKYFLIQIKWPIYLKITKSETNLNDSFSI